MAQSAEEKAAAKAAEDQVGDNGEITVKFRDHVGKPTERTFSEEVHGEAYKDLAEEFKTKHAARLIK